MDIIHETEWKSAVNKSSREHYKVQICEKKAGVPKM